MDEIAEWRDEDGWLVAYDAAGVVIPASELSIEVLRDALIAHAHRQSD